MKPKNKTKSPKKNPSLATIIICSILIFLGYLALFSAKWSISQFGSIGFDSILFTMFAGLDGTDLAIVMSYLKRTFFQTIGFWAVTVFIVFFRSKKTIYLNFFKKIKLRIFPFSRILKVILSVFLSILLCFTAASQIGIIDYVKTSAKVSNIFENKYVDPATANIVFPEKKRNIIWITVESLETTFMDKSEGGALSHNAIPNLTDLAKNYVNFSHNKGIGGGSVITGTGWTMAATVAQTAGIPLKTTANINGKDSFLPGVTTYMDILKNNGYYQAFMIGSQSRFAYLDVYLNRHGISKIYDYETAKVDGIISQDYKVWWGMEDKRVFEYARKELTKISQQSQPFSFTIQTIDTHFSNGYVCDLCQNDFERQYDNVYACSDRQVAEFIKWAKNQPFYENTTIVIVGDHITLDNNYIKSAVDSDYNRRVFNCFINSAVQAQRPKEREFCSVDLFPTILASLGCTIEGDRLGMGTNLFSAKQTLAEEMGIDEFNMQLSYASNYYTDKFVFDK